MLNTEISSALRKEPLLGDPNRGNDFLLALNVIYQF